jgi:Riboflavin synthase alpha chain
MFTGLIRDIGTIKNRTRLAGGDLSARIETSLPLADIPLGASICCSGCCLTVTHNETNLFDVDVSSESLSKTTLRDWQEGGAVNLEASLKMGDDLGGHFVFGHVDGLADIIAMERDGESWRLKIGVDKSFMPFVASDDSEALDGISLTVNELDSVYFGVNIIPHTWGEDDALNTAHNAITLILRLIC